MLFQLNLRHLLIRYFLSTYIPFSYQSCFDF